MNKITKIIMIITAIIAIIILYSSLKEFADVEYLRQILAPFGIYAVFIFIILYIIAGLMFLPVSAFSIAAGVLFGTLYGLIIALIAATLTAGIAFIIARQFQTLMPKFEAGIIQKIHKKIETTVEKNTFETIFILRLLYLPYMPLSYAAGLVKTCKLTPFLTATFITNIAGSFVFVYLGNQLGKGWKALIIPAILIIASMLIPRITKIFVKQK